MNVSPSGARNGGAVVKRLLQEVGLGIVTLAVATVVLLPSFWLIHLLFVEGLGVTLAVVGGLGVAFAIYLAHRTGMLFPR